MELDFIEPEVSKDSALYKAFYALRVDYIFDGVDPGSCVNPSLSRCERPGHSCFNLQARISATSMFSTSTHSIMISLLVDYLKCSPT